MPSCPEVQYCCDNPDSWWCWFCGVECPTRKPPVTRVALSGDGTERKLRLTGAQRAQVEVLDRAITAGPNAPHYDKALELAKVLQSARGYQQAQNVLDRILKENAQLPETRERLLLIGDAYQLKASTAALLRAFPEADDARIQARTLFLRAGRMLGPE